MKDCCLNCQGFAFWDGDYCCVPNMKILQCGINGDIWMTRDLLISMNHNKNCKDYERRNEHHPTTKMYIDEFEKFTKWDKLCKQLEKHVSDSLDYYK